MTGRFLYYGNDLTQMDRIQVPVMQAISSWAMGNGVWVVVENYVTLFSMISHIYTATGDNITALSNWNITYTETLTSET
jgi:microcystin-dependent protein